MLQKGILQKMPLSGQSRHERGKLFTRITLQSFIALNNKINDSDLMTIQAAAKALHCAINALYINWIHTHFISIVYIYHFKRIRKVDVERVQHILKEFITCSEASKALHMYRTHARNLEREGVLKGFKFGDGRTITLYRRSDIKRLARQYKKKPSINT